SIEQRMRAHRDQHAHGTEDRARFKEGQREPHGYSSRTCEALAAHEPVTRDRGRQSRQSVWRIGGHSSNDLTAAGDEGAGLPGNLEGKREVHLDGSVLLQHVRGPEQHAGAADVVGHTLSPATGATLPEVERNLDGEAWRSHES